MNPNGSRVMTNQYELEEENPMAGDGGAYDTVKQPDSGEGSQGKKKPPGDSLPPVYASVNKDHRQGNTVCEGKIRDFKNRRRMYILSECMTGKTIKISPDDVKF